MAAPLINALRVAGGTFYTFTSAANDISKTFTDDDARFVFSKFVLLDIPDVATPSNTNYENFIVWEGLGAEAGGTAYPNSSVPYTDLNVDNNINFAQSLQNYVLNYEKLILNGNNNLAQAYDSGTLSTVSERIFWKWMASLNAIRFREATGAESTVVNRFTEEDGTNYYKRVVKYIGDIDIVNNVSKNGNSYSEVYLNVPTTHGNTPLVMFKTYEDNNYGPARQWSTGNTYIDGRDSGSVHPTGLSLTAYYDDDGLNAYTSKSIFGDFSNWTGYATSDPLGLSLKPVLLSRMDGIVLDMDPISYKPIVDDPNVSLISEFNASLNSSDFSFNGALVYYDTYSQSNPQTRARNLYGVLVLDDYVNQSGGNSYLKRYDKFKPNAITKLNGNGYGLKLNIKFDTSSDNVGVETVINDYNTFSMDLFIDASTKMQDAAQMFLDQNLQIIEMKKQIDALESYYFSRDTIDLMAQRISALEKALVNASLAYKSSTTMLDLINKNADNINQLVNGNLPITLTYNTDILKGDDNILLDKSVPNQIKIKSKTQGYNNFMLCKNTSGFIQTGPSNGLNLNNPDTNNVIVLDKFTNYFRQKNTDTDPLTGIEIFDDNVYININDKNIRWKKGQTLRFVFSEEINANGSSIIFRTDSENIFGNGVYGKNIGIIPSVKLLSNIPIFEIICTDENQYLFNIDIIR